ncbi:MAG TPA: hypothetical protein VFR07_11925 [Mycobacteriales bacterium]|nr:hypothetical protein [Mycobacteriales bacterium]
MSPDLAKRARRLAARRVRQLVLARQAARPVVPPARRPDGAATRG